MADLIIQPKNNDHLKLNNDAGTTILELANDESKLRLAQNNISASDGTTAITTSGANVTLAGTANNIGTVTSGTFNGTIGNSASFPAGKIIKTTFSLRTGGTLQITDNTITTSSSVNYTCESSSNKLVLIGLGALSRGTQNGAGAIYYYLDSDLISEYQNRDFRDSDEMPIHNTIIDGYSGSKEILLKIQSLSNNSKVFMQDGNGFVILEIKQ